MNKKSKVAIALFLIWTIVMILFMLPIGGYESGIIALFGNETPLIIKILASIAGFGFWLGLLVYIIRQRKK